MRCLRFDLHRKMASYVNGGLSEETTLDIEDHLTDCAECQERLSQVQDGDRWARLLPGIPAPDDAWPLIESAVSARPSVPATPRTRLWIPAAAIAASLILIAVLTLTSRSNSTFVFDSDMFQEVPIDKLSGNVEPHVATEGYISEVRMDEEDGDLMFKLVDNLHSPNHFIMCEIIPPMKMEIPEIGSRIRVYGVHRYDGKLDHQWNEVHPVLNIERVH